MKAKALFFLCITQCVFSINIQTVEAKTDLTVMYQSLGKYTDKSGSFIFAASIKNISGHNFNWFILNQSSRLIDVDVRKLSITEYEKGLYIFTKPYEPWKNGEIKSLVFSTTRAFSVNLKIKLCYAKNCQILSIAEFKNVSK